MNRTRIRVQRCVLIGVLLLAASSGGAPCDEWPQWGGPNRDFTVEASELAEQWARGGPTRLWRRALGDGYSAIVYSDGVLFTMYRIEPAATDERIVALDAHTGRTVWEQTYPAPLAASPDKRWGGLGPNSTPVIDGRRLFTVGSNAMMRCFDKTSGELLWSRDLVAEYGAPYPNSGEVGYSASPLVHDDRVIVSVGREDRPGAARGQSLIALDQSTGNEVWKNLDFEMGLSSPIMIRFGDRSQLVLYDPPEVVALDPDDGSRLWSLDVGIQNPIVSPVFDGTDRLFCSSRSGRSGVTTIRLSQQGRETVPELLWTRPKPVLNVPTPVIVDHLVFGSTKKTMFGVDLETGETVWEERGFPNAACVFGDGKLIILDENGKLSLATATPEGLTVHARSRITERYSFTHPTLVDGMLYVRDRKEIMALDLGAASQSGALRDDQRRRRIRNGFGIGGLIVVLVLAATWLRGRRSGTA